MLFALDDLTTPLTQEEVEESIYTGLGIVGVDVTNWKPGAVARTLIVVVAIVISSLSSLQALVARSGFLELATGFWLTLVARYVYGVERQLATFATGEITLVNAGGGDFTYDEGDLVFINPDTEKSYTNSEPVILGPLATDTFTIRALEEGSSSTSGPDTIVLMGVTLSDVTCTNAAGVVGLDEETDPILRIRCSDKLGSLSPNGPKDAYAYVARSLKRPDGSSVGVTRVGHSRDGYGNIYITVAGASGAIPGDADDPETDLGMVYEALVSLAEPLGITVYVESAEPVAIAVTYEMWVYATVADTNAVLQSKVATALAQLMSAQPIGGNKIAPDPGKVFNEQITTKIVDTRPEIFKARLTLPAADTTLTSTQVPVIGTVTATAIHRMPAGAI